MSGTISLFQEVKKSSVILHLATVNAVTSRHASTFGSPQQKGPFGLIHNKDAREEEMNEV